MLGLIKRGNILQPKVGFVALGATTEVFGVANPEKAIEKLNTIRIDILKQLKNLKIDIIDPANKTVTSAEELQEVIEKFKRERIDIVILLFCSWSHETLPLILATELISCPILIWALPEAAESASLCGVLATGSNMMRRGFCFDYLIGSAKDEKTINKVLKAAKVAAAVKKLQRSKIGIVGTPPPGMMDVICPEMEWGRIVHEIVHLDLTELLMRYKEIRAEKAEELAKQISKEIRVSPSITENELIDASRMYFALKEIVVSYRLDAITVRCFPELWELGLPICFAFSRLSDEGICTSCECDLKMAVTQLAIQWLTGLSSMNVDIGAINYEENSVFLFHCGAAGTKLAQSLGEIEIRRHPMSNGGVQVNLEMRRGKVTLAKLTDPFKGKFKMLIFTGEVVKSPPSFGNYALVKLDSPVSKVIDLFIKEQGGHHIAVTPGDIREELIELCHFLNVEAVLI